MQDGRRRYQARQGLHCDPDLALLISAAYVSRKTLAESRTGFGARATVEGKIAHPLCRAQALALG
jgi:hypothetical protein